MQNNRFSPAYLPKDSPILRGLGIDGDLVGMTIQHLSLVPTHDCRTGLMDTTVQG